MVGVKLGFAVVEKLKSCLSSCFPFLLTVMLDQAGGLLPVLVTWVTHTVTKVQSWVMEGNETRNVERDSFSCQDKF